MINYKTYGHIICDVTVDSGNRKGHSTITHVSETDDNSHGSDVPTSRKQKGNFLICTVHNLYINMMNKLNYIISFFQHYRKKLSWSLI